MREKIRRIFGLFAFLFLVWGCYRLIFRFPEDLEELVLKPIFWLGSTFWLVLNVEKKKLSSLGFTFKNFFQTLYLGIGLGIIFALAGLITNYLKYEGFQFSNTGRSTFSFLWSLFVSFATAVSEETVFRGYIFNRLNETLKNEKIANILAGLMFVLIHLPISIFVFQYSFLELLIYSLLVFLFSFGSAVVFTKSQNIVSSILAHVFWSWPVILFK